MLYWIDYNGVILRDNDLHSDMWQDEPCFILGGGPSLAKFDFSSLDLFNTIAINMAFVDCPHAEITYIGDSRLIDRLRDDSRWASYLGRKVSRKSQLDRAADGHQGYYALHSIKGWPETVEEGVADLGNAGAAALNIACSLGSNPIFLLGYDCQGRDSRGRMTNYHKEYPPDWAKPEGFSTAKFTKTFDKISELISSTETAVLNCCPESAIRAFPRITPSNALAWATEIANA